MRILIRGPNYLGDHIMAFGFYAALFEKYPTATIEIMLPKFLAEWDDGFGWSKKHTLLNPRSITEGFSFRKNSWDLGFNLRASYSSQIFFNLLLIRKRVGFTEGIPITFGKNVSWQGVKANLHKSELYFRLLDFRPERKKNEPQVLAKKNQWVIAPQASIALREWPYFKELLSSLDGDLLVLGNKKDPAYDLIPRVTNLTGKTSLNEATEILKQSRGFIGNDSGLAHLAATVAQIPTYVLMGPGNPKYIKPLGERVSVIREENLSCSPCEKAYCKSPHGHKACLNNLPKEKVLLKIFE